MILALRAFAARLTGQAISTFARFITAPRAIWQGIEPVHIQRVYFANHSSIGREVFNAVLIDRRPGTRTEDPVAQMTQALDQGSSLILFPEGQRNSSDMELLPFKSGLYHLAKARPGVDLVPVWIANLNRVMPKGEIIPVPLICTLTFGTPLHLTEDEPKDAFLARATKALLALKPQAAA
jgi:1-acyl-sn-glycerol-3-phosphate acyltransferase